MTTDELIDMVNHPLDRFGWTVVLRVPDLGPCWEWNGSRMERRGGYGQVRYQGRVQKTHRLAYERWVGEIPEELNVLHHCDNPPCIMPVHLFVGTHADNAADKVAKGRGVNPVFYGEDVPAAKLTVEDVEHIRAMLARGCTLAELGRRFGVTKQAIWRIKEGQTWAT